ncbi:MAG: hypothetical protein SNJ71_04170, partial [Bacteroidales bacterium]
MRAQTAIIHAQHQELSKVNGGVTNLNQSLNTNLADLKNVFDKKLDILINVLSVNQLEDKKTNIESKISHFQGKLTRDIDTVSTLKKVSDKAFATDDRGFLIDPNAAEKTRSTIARYGEDYLKLEALKDKKQGLVEKKWNIETSAEISGEEKTRMIKEIESNIEELEKQIKPLDDLFDSLDRNKVDFMALGTLKAENSSDEALAKKIIATAKGYEEGFTNYNVSLKNTFQTLTGFNNQLNEVNESLKRLREQINNLRAPENRVNNPEGERRVNEARGRAEANRAAGLATGGFIDFKPRGTDTVPAMLTPGEYVVRASAAARNRGLLEAINSGKISFFSKGGEVKSYKGYFLNRLQPSLGTSINIADSFSMGELFELSHLVQKEFNKNNLLTKQFSHTPKKDVSKNSFDSSDQSQNKQNSISNKSYSNYELVELVKRLSEESLKNIYYSMNLHRKLSEKKDEPKESDIKYQYRNIYIPEYKRQIEYYNRKVIPNLLEYSKLKDTSVGNKATYFLAKIQEYLNKLNLLPKSDNEVKNATDKQIADAISIIKNGLSIKIDLDKLKRESVTELEELNKKKNQNNSLEVKTHSENLLDKTKSKPEPKIEVKKESKILSVNEEKTKSKPQTESKTKLSSETKTQPSSETKAQPSPENKAQNPPEAKVQSSPEPKAKPLPEPKAQPQTTQLNSATPNSNQHKSPESSSLNSDTKNQENSNTFNNSRQSNNSPQNNQSTNVQTPDEQKVRHFSSGGIVDFNRGAFNKGTDVVPAVLTPGEFVVNAKATSRNVDLLRSINSGKLSYFADGGEVTPTRKYFLSLIGSNKGDKSLVTRKFTLEELKSFVQTRGCADTAPDGS